VPDPVIPPQEKAASRSEAEAQYREFRLSKVVLGGVLPSGDEAVQVHSQALLPPIYPEQPASPERQFRRNEPVDPALGVWRRRRKFFIYPIGWYFAEDNIRPTEYVFFKVSVVSAGVSIILSILADDSFEEATAAYNLDLRQTLGAE
jgi:hypothetical protein